METSENIGELAAALAKAQGQITNPSKNRTVTVRSEKGSYTFDYATLDAVFDAIRKPLADNGLAFTQALHKTDRDLLLTTTLVHSSGQWIRTQTPVMVTGNGMQALGSAQTYARRYAISSLLGVVADEDDDANTADGNGIEEKKDKPAPKKATPRQEAEPWKATAEQIKKAIDDAKDSRELEGVMKNATQNLAAIKEKSETAYAFLMDRSAKRAGVLAQAPTEEAA